MSGVDHVGALEQKVQALLEGFRQEFPDTVETVRFGGRSMAWGEMVAQLQAMHDAFQAVHQARDRLRDAVGRRRAAMKEHRSLYGDFVVFLKHLLGKDDPRLVRFGLSLPRARRALTAEANALARAKAAATRKARGTMGKRQRLALGRPREATLQLFDADGHPLGPKVESKVEPEPEPPAGR